MKKLSVFLLLLTVILFPVGVNAQTAVVYQVTAIDYQREGSSFFGGGTRKEHLLHFLGVKEGLEFSSEDALRIAVNGWDQRLRGSNTFIAKESFVEYSTADESGSGIVPVTVIIFAKEAINATTSPSFKFSSNDGLSIGARMRHYNFLGTMSPLMASIYYRKDENGRHIFESNIDLIYPILIKGHKYNIITGVSGGYQTNTESGFVLFRGTLGLSSSWTLSRNGVSFGGFGFSIIQAAYVLGAALKDEHLRYDDTYFLYSQLGINSNFNLANIQGKWGGSLTYSPSVSTSIAYRFDDALYEQRRGVNLDLNHSLSFGAIRTLDSHFRQGYQLRIYNNNRFNFYRLKEYGLMWNDTPSNKSGLRVDTGASFTAFIPFLDQFAINMRVGVDYKPWQREDGAFDVYEDWASRIRGARNDAMRGNLLFYWNLEFEAKVWMWRLSRLMDVHAKLFFDGGILHSALVSEKGGWQQPFAGIGAEIRIIPLGSRNLATRISLGINANRWFGWELRGSAFELFIGQEIHF
ncbi:hypothetical protein PVA45_06470 [Entomospira entomophila]|uniref:Bacterial surface antigen (D15) domain-containing protein n=1 Tax=Entomospira entomophila TaxID=2719988 RepID=A0A968KRV3_9SPIO|nr:hypothetical protein [Entomospira entomophilus]NIZ41143.1 hypothetical protein [Entomospira entomophilus]WDI35350.1 hypothetical protein PVA45_06470 [Entomospira entomophilus]